MGSNSGEGGGEEAKEAGYDDSPIFDSDGSGGPEAEPIHTVSEAEKEQEVEELVGDGQGPGQAHESDKSGDGQENVAGGQQGQVAEEGGMEEEEKEKEVVKERVVTGLSSFTLFGNGLPKATVVKTRPERSSVPKTAVVKEEECASGLVSAEFQAARKSLYESLEKARELSAALEASHVRLRGIGERIPNLEAAMEPLQAQSKLVRGLNGRIDRAMGPAAAVLKGFDNLHDLEVVLLDGVGEDLFGYLTAVARLEDSLEFLGKNCPVAVQWLQEAVDFLGKSAVTDKYRMHRLNEALSVLRQAQAAPEQTGLDGGLLNLALEQLESEFGNIVLHHSTPVSLPEAAPVGTEETVLMPPDVVEKLQSIVHKLSVNRQLDGCVEAYCQARSSSALGSLKYLGGDYLQYSTPEVINMLDWNDLEGYIGLWTQQFEVAVKLLYGPERSLCAQVFARAEPHVWRDCFLRLSQAGMLLFLQFGEGVARSQKTPEKLFKLLDMFEALENLSPSIAEVFAGEGCTEMRSRARELQKHLVHGSCQVLWEFSRQLLEGQTEGTLPADGSHPKLSSYVINYVKYLVSEFYGPIMAQVLKIEQSWRQEPPKKEERGLAHAVLTIVQALERNAEARAKGYKDPALAHIFLMNNIQYMYDRSSKCELGALLGDSWMREHRRKVEQHSLGYQREDWGKVLAHLSREGLLVSSGGRGAARDLVKQRLRLFTTAFEETVYKQSKWSIPDADLRRDVRQAVVQVVQSAYRSYIQSYGSLLDQGAAASRYLKYTPESLETKLNDLFLGPNNLYGPGATSSRNGDNGPNSL